MTPPILNSITLAGAYTTAMETAYRSDRIAAKHHVCDNTTRFKALRTWVAGQVTGAKHRKLARA